MGKYIDSKFKCGAKAESIQSALMGCRYRKPKCGTLKKFIENKKKEYRCLD